MNLLRQLAGIVSPRKGPKKVRRNLVVMADESGWYREASALAPVQGRELFIFLEHESQKGGGRMETDLGDLQSCRLMANKSFESEKLSAPAAGNRRIYE